MLNAYKKPAGAESQKGIGGLVADNAAGQHDSSPAEMSPAQLFYDVVSYNIVNPDERIALLPEQGKEIMAGFVNFVADGENPPMTKDGRVQTFSEMSDNELLKRLSEFLGSGIADPSVNGAIIEGAQELLAELYMSEEELAELPNPKTANGKAARERIILERMKDAADQMAAAQARWDNQMHSIGGREYSGAHLHAMHKWLSNEENAEEFEKLLANKYKISPEEARRRRMAAQEYLEILEKERNGQVLTEEEKRRKLALEQQPGLSETIQTLSEKVVAPVAQGYGFTEQSAKTGQLKVNKEESASSGADTWQELVKLMEDENADADMALLQQKIMTSNANDTAQRTFDTQEDMIASKPVASDLDDLMSPLIQAPPLKPAFAKAEASKVPLDNMPAVITSYAKQSPQLGGLDV